MCDYALAKAIPYLSLYYEQTIEKIKWEFCSWLSSWQLYSPLCKFFMEGITLSYRIINDRLSMWQVIFLALHLLSKECDYVTIHNSLINDTSMYQLQFLFSFSRDQHIKSVSTGVISVLHTEKWPTSSHSKYQRIPWKEQMPGKQILFLGE